MCKKHFGKVECIYYMDGMSRVNGFWEELVSWPAQHLLTWKINWWSFSEGSYCSIYVHAIERTLICPHMALTGTKFSSFRPNGDGFIQEVTRQGHLQAESNKMCCQTMQIKGQANNKYAASKTQHANKAKITQQSCWPMRPQLNIPQTVQWKGQNSSNATRPTTEHSSNSKRTTTTKNMLAATQQALQHNIP